MAFAPILMKTLSIVGTAAMFLVGGGIINHAIPFVHHFTEDTVEYVQDIPTDGQHCRCSHANLDEFCRGYFSGCIGW